MRQQDLGQLGQGNHQITLDLSGLAVGVYFYSVNVDGIAVSKKVMVTAN
ncbi:MAG: T9SS type A sorting domain-containing protein [Ignavibacteriales bacterium]|nr:T9SS type A sorting domain-containing protein [Ignavibacteriales bacterium]